MVVSVDADRSNGGSVTRAFAGAYNPTARWRGSVYTAPLPTQTIRVSAPVPTRPNIK